MADYVLPQLRRKDGIGIASQRKSSLTGTQLSCNATFRPR